MRKTFTIIALSVAVLSGCGGSDEPDPAGAEKAVTGFIKSLEAEDGAAACEALLPSYAKDFTAQIIGMGIGKKGDSCRDVFKAVIGLGKNDAVEGDFSYEHTTEVTSTSEDKAVIEVVYTNPPEGTEPQDAKESYNVEFVHGKWLIAGETTSNTLDAPTS